MKSFRHVSIAHHDFSFDSISSQHFDYSFIFLSEMDKKKI